METKALKLAYAGNIPPKELYHDPTIRDYNGMTVAMLLAWS